MKKIVIFSLISFFTPFLGAIHAPIEDVAQFVMKGNIEAVRDFIFEGGNISESVVIPAQVPAKSFEKIHGSPEVTMLVEWAMGDHETTLLHLSIANLQPEITDMLIAEGAQVNAPNELGRTALVEAIMLLDDVRAPRTKLANSVRSVLTKAGRKEITERLFRKLAYLHSHYHDMSYRTALRICSGSFSLPQKSMVSGLEDTIATLLSCPGIDVDKTSEWGENPLCKAIASGERIVVAQLIEAGANPFISIGSKTARTLAKELCIESDDCYEIYQIVKSSRVQPPAMSTMQIATRRLGKLYNHLTQS